MALLGLIDMWDQLDATRRARLHKQFDLIIAQIDRVHARPPQSAPERGACRGRSSVIDVDATDTSRRRVGRPELLPGNPGRVEPTERAV